MVISTKKKKKKLKSIILFATLILAKAQLTYLISHLDFFSNFSKKQSVKEANKLYIYVQL